MSPSLSLSLRDISVKQNRWSNPITFDYHFVVSNRDSDGYMYIYIDINIASILR